MFVRLPSVRSVVFKPLLFILCLQVLFPASFLTERAYAAEHPALSAEAANTPQFYLYDLEHQSLPFAEARAQALEEYKKSNEETLKDLDKDSLKKKLSEFLYEWNRSHQTPRYFPYNELSFVVKNADGKVIDILSFEQLSNKNFSDSEISTLEVFSPRVDLAVLKINLRANMFRIVGSKLFFNDAREPQFLKYIDLEYYEDDLGKARLPVFRLPIEDPASFNSIIFSFDKRTGVYTYGKTPFTSDDVDYYRDLEELSYNLAVSLLDKKTYENAYDTVVDLDRYFAKGLSLMRQSSDQVSSMVAGETGKAFRSKLSKDLLSIAEHAQAKTAEPLVENAEQSSNTVASKASGVPESEKTEVESESLDRVVEEQIAHKNAASKISKLQKLLTLPRAFSSNRLLGTLDTMDQEGLLHPQAKEKLETLRKSGGKFWNATLEKVVSIRQTLGPHSGKIVTGLLFASTAFLFLHPAAREALDATAGAVTHFKELMSFIAQPGELARMGTRLLLGGVGTVALIASVTHFGVVFHHIFRDWKAETDKETKGFSDFLIERQQKLQKVFEDSQDEEKIKQAAEAKKKAEAANKKQQNIKIEEKPERVYTAEENETVTRILSELENKGANKTSVFQKIKNVFKNKKEDSGKISSFWRALKHSMFSMASFTDSQMSVIPFYNKIFFVRSFGWRPLFVSLWARYPHLAGKVLSDVEELTLPTKANGGLRSRMEQMSLLLNRKHRDLQNAWESKIVSVERVIGRVALREAGKAVVAGFKNTKDLQKFYVDEGISSISDPEIMKLSRAQRKVFSAHYAAISEEILVRFLKKKMHFGTQVKDDSIKELKRATLEQIDDLEISDGEVEAILAEIKAETSVDKLVENRKSSSIESTRWKAVQKLDPASSRATERIQSVMKKLSDPIAVARAVRQALAGIFIDKPLEFVMMLLCLAAVDSGINQLFTSEFLSRDSIAYLGAYPLLMGFAFGTLISVLADAWMKLQIDAGNEENFGEVPEGKDAKLGRLGWLFKQTFFNKDNQFFKNHKHISKIIYANIPAYLVMIIPIQLLALGRIELDTLIAGYLFYFFGPLSTLGVHLDQGFEFASYYDLKHFPKDLRRHPEVLKYLNKKQTQTRLVFNIFAKSYENFAGFFMTTLMTLQAAGMGTKSFLRTIFGGFLPAEWVLNATQVTANAAQGVPVLEQATHVINRTCEWFLQNGYKDGTRLVPGK